MSLRRLISHFSSPVPERVVGKDGLRMYWFSGFANIGDVISPLIVGALSGTTIVQADKRDHPKLLAVGSIMQYARAGDVVWGSGCIASDFKLKTTRLKVCAVRGPRTRGILQQQGVECPEVYGDPAILLPSILDVGAVPKTHALGIVPHYSDAHLVKVDDPGVRVISVTDGPEAFVRQLLSCDRIVSSSLHGIILAEAYGVAADWVKLSGNLMGGDFKFHDYYEGTGRTVARPLAAEELYAERDIAPPQFASQELIRAFPYANKG